MTAAVTAGLRFEQAADVSGGGGHASGGLHFLDGVRIVRRRPVLAWSMLGTYGQVLTRGLLNALLVVAAIELLDMGQWGLGLLGAALGVGALVGAIFAVSSTRSVQLVRTETVSLAFWGLPIAAIGVLPFPIVAMMAMVTRSSMRVKPPRERGRERGRPSLLNDTDHLLDGGEPEPALLGGQPAQIDDAQGAVLPEHGREHLGV